jgi:putative selenium metabolism protein SsnA
MMTYCLKSAQCVVPHPPRLFRADVLIRDGRISQVAPDIEPPEDAEVIYLNNKLLLPGQVCAHTHLYSALARGMPGPAEPPQNFVQILERIWWRLDRALDQESLYLSALVGAIEAVKVGTTCLIDHNASPNFIRGSLAAIARALDEIGLRGVLCYEVTDRGGAKERDEGIEESQAFLEGIEPRGVREGETERGGNHLSFSPSLHPSVSPSPLLPLPLVRGLVGAHASFTLSDETLRQCAELVERFQTGLHIHVAEDAYDEIHAKENYGRTVIERLARFGLLNEKTILAHGVHLAPEEIAAVQQAGSWLVHNPRSNLNNCVGRAPVETFGDRVVLGTDGISADMFEESKTAFFRAREAVRGAQAETYLRMLSNGQQIISQSFGARFGAIEPGAVADLIILDYQPPTPLTAENLAWHWMFGIASWQVESVMVGGRFIYRDRKFLTVDPAAIYEQARECAARLWERVVSS